jgi:hypothetical protein
MSSSSFRIYPTKALTVSSQEPPMRASVPMLILLPMIFLLVFAKQKAGEHEQRFAPFACKQLSVPVCKKQ